MNKFGAWKGIPQCEGCTAKLSVFRRKKPCFSCKNYFCQVCMMQRPDKKMCCRKCQILTAIPLDKNDLLNLRSRDLVNYLASRHISTSGCVEKEDLVNLLMRVVNNSSSASHSVSSSGSNSYSNSPSRYSGSDFRIDSNSDPSQSADNSFHEDGIRIVGMDIPDNSGSHSPPNHSTSFEVLNEPSSMLEDTLEDTEPVESAEEANECNDVNPQSSNAPEVETPEVKELKKERGPGPLKLSDISCSEDLDNLSVKELKTLLMTNRTDFKGCVERAELIERASRLWSDYTLSRKDLEKLSLEELCKICMDAPIECVLLECGHMATCMLCGKQLSECPVCRQYVVRCVRTFKV